MAVITGGKTLSQLTSIASLSPTTLFHVVEAGVNNTITRANLYTDISTTLGLGTAAFLDVGTGPNNVVQLDGSSLLPAVDGSQLINLPMFVLASGSGTTANGSAVDLGGALSGDVTITGSSDAFTIRNNATGFTQLIVGGSGGNAARTIIESDSGTDLRSFVSVNNQVLTLFARDGNSGIEEAQMVMNGSVVTWSSPSDGATWQGIEYDQDISANFTANSLVNRAYVDAQTFLLASGEGTTANGSAVDLGGTYGADVTITSSSAAATFAIQSQNGNEIQVRNADVQLNTGSGETPGSDRGHIDVADALVKLEAESSADGPVGLELGSSGGDVFFRYNATLGTPTSFASGEIPTAEYLHSTFGESQIASNVRNPGAPEDGQHLTWNDGASEWQLEAPPTVVASSGAAGEVQFSDGSGGFDSNPLFTAVFGGTVPSIDISGEVTTAAAIGFNVGDVYVGGNATHNVYKYSGGVNTVTYGTSFDPIAILANGTDVFISIGAPLNQVFRYADGGAFGAAITGFTTPGFIHNGNSRLFIGDVNEINVYNEAAPNAALPTENIGSGVLNDVRGIAVDTINNRVYAVDATNNRVNVFDITTPTAPVSVPAEEFGIGDFTNPSNIQLVGGKAYVGNRGTGQILVYDVATQTALPGETIAIASLEQFYLDGTTLYATTQSNSLTIQSIASPLITLGAETTLQSNKIIDLADPTNAQDAVTKTYADANLGGNDLDANVIVPGAPEDGFVVAWNDTNNEYELVAPSGGGGGSTSGEYTPVGTNVANVASSTFAANSGRWTSVGSGVNNIVTVFMEVSITPTAGSTLTQLRVTLPIAATLANSHDLIGSGAVATAFSTVYGGVQVQSDTANNEALIEFVSESTFNHVVRCSFSYLDN